MKIEIEMTHRGQKITIEYHGEKYESLIKDYDIAYSNGRRYLTVIFENSNTLRISLNNVEDFCEW